MDQKIELLTKKREEARIAGGEKAIQAQHEEAATARERVDALFDAGTFHELDALSPVAPISLADEESPGIRW